MTRAPRASLGRKRRLTPGTLNDLKTELWYALRTAAHLLDDPDSATRLKAVHAFSAVAGQYRGLHEALDLEARVGALEAVQARGLRIA